MDTEIRYRESSARPYESTGAFLTADDVNELCQRRIEAERERTHALLTELLIQICDNTIPEVVSTLPELRGPTGPVACWQAADCPGVGARDSLLRRLRRHL